MVSLGPPPPPTSTGSAITYSGFPVVAAWVPTPPHSSALPTYHGNARTWLPFVSLPLPSASLSSPSECGPSQPWSPPPHTHFSPLDSHLLSFPASQYPPPSCESLPQSYSEYYLTSKYYLTSIISSAGRAFGFQSVWKIHFREDGISDLTGRMTCLRPHSQLLETQPLPPPTMPPGLRGK